MLCCPAPEPCLRNVYKPTTPPSKALICTRTHTTPIPQEVENYEGDYRPFLESLGMDSLFVHKPYTSNGCLLAWRRDRWV